MSAREADLIKQLQERDEQLQQTKDELQKSNDALAQANRKIELLQQKIDLLVRRMFGSRAEKLDRAQLLLLLEGLDEPGKAPEPVAALTQ